MESHIVHFLRVQPIHTLSERVSGFSLNSCAFCIRLFTFLTYTVSVKWGKIDIECLRALIYPLAGNHQLWQGNGRIEDNPLKRTLWNIKEKLQCALLLDCLLYKGNWHLLESVALSPTCLPDDLSYSGLKWENLGLVLYVDRCRHLVVFNQTSICVPLSLWPSPS